MPRIWISQLNRYPLKGARGISTTVLDLDPKVGVVHDREFALQLVPGDPTRRADRMHKKLYLACANDPRVAAEDPRYLSEPFRLNPDFVRELRERIGGELTLQESKGKYHLADTAGAQVSFLNLETHRAFEKFLGMSVDAERWRMNVWIENLPAFAEYEWANTWPGTREIHAGTVRLRVDDACERCKAPDANPRTGEYDIDIRKALEEFMGRRGYRSPQRGVKTVMGFYGVVMAPGKLHIGDNITAL